MNAFCGAEERLGCGGRLVRVAASGVHGLGLFAGECFYEGDRIVEYVGERISKSESIRRCSEGNQFIFYLDDEWDLDGSPESNLARFANHHCAPNCAVELIEGRLWLVASRSIASDEELTFDYAYDLADYRDHGCNCGAANCVGYIVAAELRAFVSRRK